MHAQISFRKLSVRVLTGALCILAIQVSPRPAQALNAVSIPANITFEEVASGLTDPLFITHAGDGSGRIFIAQRGGKIMIYKNGAVNNSPFLDVGSLITTNGGEQGLLGLAFDPNYTTNGRFFITYTDASDGAVKLARYSVSGGDADIADPGGTVVLTISEPYENHNGGMLAFGPDGYLYLGVGDGGSGGDPQNNGQNKNTLLGKILRLDVSGPSYTIPPTNPFVAQSNVKKEIWAYGMRNPWRFSFDSANGDLYIGDVGQDREEEIDYQPASSLGGENYGWRVLEGNLCYPSGSCNPPSNYAAPVSTYDHGSSDSNGCSVTGGYIYRGSQFPGLVGIYLYGDYCRGKVWGLYESSPDHWTSKLIADTNYSISSFGEDETGEIYLADYGSGTIYRVIEAPLITETFTSTAAYDGMVREFSETSGTGRKRNATTSTLKLGDDSVNRQFRSILSFDSSPLPDNAVITSASLSFKYAGETGTLPFITHGDLLADICKCVFNGNISLQRGDFSAPASKNGILHYKNVQVNSWFIKNLKTKYLDRINQAGSTQFRLRFALDDNNDSITDLLLIYSGDAALEDRPQLMVEYFIP